MATTAAPDHAPAPWVYAYSEALKMRYAHRKTPFGLEAMTADKVRYSAAEVKLMALADMDISRELHALKRLFYGQIVDIIEPGPTGPVVVPKITKRLYSGNIEK